MACGIPTLASLCCAGWQGVEGSSISVTSMLAPDKARKAYEHGMQNLLKNKPGDAARDFEKAVALYPGYADAWANLGKLLLQQQAIEPARAALRKAVEADPKLVAPWVELGVMAAKDANWKESAELLDRAVKLDPVDFPQAWYAAAVAHYNLKNYVAAEKSAREAVKLDPRHVNPRSCLPAGAGSGRKAGLFGGCGGIDGVYEDGAGCAGSDPCEGGVGAH